MKVHALWGVDCSYLFIHAGAWRFLRLKISNGWFRLFYCTMIHIGELIEEELHRQERSVTWFANKLYCDRSNVYKIFKKQSIDTELLLRISVILNCDFFKYYSQALYS